MRTISYTSARANFAETMREVCEDHQPIVITRSNAKPAVMISLDDFEAMEESNYLLQSPVNAQRLAESIEEIEALINAKGK